MSDRSLSWDWYPGEVPANASIDATAYIETTFSFHCYRSEVDPGVTYGRGAASYLGTMFDVGPSGRVSIGDYALVNGVRFICDDEITIGDYALLSWNVVLMDTYRASLDVDVRRSQLRELAFSDTRVLAPIGDARPVHIGNNVWIGFDVCILPGVTIGDGSIVGAKSVVFDDVPPYTVVAGNPASVIRVLEHEVAHAKG